MVRFVLTPELQETIREYNAVIRKRKASEEIDEKCDSIQHLQLAQVASTLQKEYPIKRDEYSLHNILKHTSLYLEPKPKPKPTPEYQARMDALRKRMEQQEYDSMVRNIRPPQKSSLFSDEDVSASDSKMVKNQISAVINILLSMVSVFVAIFIWMKNSPDHLRVLWSLFFAAIVGISEAGLYMLHWWNVEQNNSPKAKRAREKRNAQRITVTKKTQ